MNDIWLCKHDVPPTPAVLASLRKLASGYQTWRSQDGSECYSFARAQEMTAPDVPGFVGQWLRLRCVQELPDGYRVVLTLYLLEGYDHAEIAGILGITESTSKSQYSRARKKLLELASQRGLKA